MKARFHSSVPEVMRWLSRVTLTTGPAPGGHSVGVVRTICGVCAEAQLIPLRPVQGGAPHVGDPEPAGAQGELCCLGGTLPPSVLSEESGPRR